MRNCSVELSIDTDPLDFRQRQHLLLKELANNTRHVRHM